MSHQPFYKNGRRLALIINFKKSKTTLDEWPPGFRKSCKEELRNGHTYFFHSYILRQEYPPEYLLCQTRCNRLY